MYIHRLCGISEQNNFISFGSVPEFEASQYPVTNGEFLEFVESGGYQNRQLWTDEGQGIRYRDDKYLSNYHNVLLSAKNENDLMIQKNVCQLHVVEMASPKPLVSVSHVLLKCMLNVFTLIFYECMYV